nr:glycine betaine ABC transporter substrate-binding protein [Rappaport israeli]
MPTFEKVYGFQLEESQLLVLSGGNTSATIQAAARGTNGVNAAMVYATDGALAALDLHVLADDKQSQVVYAPAVVVRGAVAREYPELQAWFAPVFARLDLQTLQALNARILLEGVSASVVASEFLDSVAH